MLLHFHRKDFLNLPPQFVSGAAIIFSAVSVPANADNVGVYAMEIVINAVSPTAVTFLNCLTKLIPPFKSQVFLPHVRLW